MTGERRRATADRRRKAGTAFRRLIRTGLGSGSTRATRQNDLEGRLRELEAGQGRSTASGRSDYAGELSRAKGSKREGKIGSASSPTLLGSFVGGLGVEESNGAAAQRRQPSSILTMAARTRVLTSGEAAASVQGLGGPCGTFYRAGRGALAFGPRTAGAARSRGAAGLGRVPVRPELGEDPDLSLIHI